MDQKTYVEGFHDPNQVKKMTYNQLGNTELFLSKLALGGGPLGGVYGEAALDECIKTVHTALKSGVNYIDTSPWYGNGKSEEVLGKSLKGVPRQAYYIGTKVGRYEQDPLKMFDFSAKKTEESVDTSLKLLGLDYVDVIQVHDLEFAENTDIIVNETLPTLAKIVKQGKARYIGITGYPLYVLKEVIEKSSVKIDMILSYCRNTLFDDTIEEYLPFLQGKGIGVINACAVAMGMLTAQGGRSWHPASQELKDASKKAFEHCKSQGVDLARIAVRHSIATKGIASHLMGANTCDIFLKNLDTVTSAPTELELRLIEEVKEKFFKKIAKKHWEDEDPAKYWKVIKQLRGEIPKDPNEKSFYGDF
ncbi:uncharacterized protein [Palaemon carinicauda]|uniref:uncharacterized protein n=1 Tax=Palaemon carinicauda TaxID=392227 RepID=UPI0035B5D77E